MSVDEGAAGLGELGRQNQSEKPSTAATGKALDEKHRVGYIVHDGRSDAGEAAGCCSFFTFGSFCRCNPRRTGSRKEAQTETSGSSTPSPTNTSFHYAQTIAANNRALTTRARQKSHASLSQAAQQAMSHLLYTDPPELDHIIHLVPTGKLKDATRQFQKLGFKVESGGVHSDGLTQNALIVLTDGVYIELIEFLDKPLASSSEKETLAQWKERRGKHWWWGRKPGWIDWCLVGGKADGCVAAINDSSDRVMQTRKAEAEAVLNGDEKAGAQGKITDPEKAAAAHHDGGHLRAITSSLGRHNGEKKHMTTQNKLGVPQDLVRYQSSIEGGREALSGKHLKWHVTFPDHKLDVQRGTFPFWCEDQTPRWWRVPTPSPQHPNLSKGLAALTLLYYPETFPSRLASLQLVLGSRQAASAGQNGDVSSDISSNIVDTRPPPKTEGRTALPDTLVEFFLGTPEGPLLPLRIKAAQDPSEIQWLEDNGGEGLYEVEISVAPEKLPSTAPPDGIERETAAAGTFGRLRLHPMRAHVAPPKPATVSSLQQPTNRTLAPTVPASP